MKEKKLEKRKEEREEGRKGKRRWCEKKNPDSEYIEIQALLEINKKKR